MKSIPQFRTDAPITAEQYRYIDDIVKVTARKRMIGRRLMATYGPLGFGKETIRHYNLTEVADAQLDFAWKVDKGEDIANLASDDVKIPVLSRAFRINARSLAASQTAGTPIDTVTAQSAAYKLAKLEDELIIDGYAADGSTYDIKGLYQINIGNVITGSQWTAAPEDALTDTAAGIAYLMGVNVDPPYNWVLHPTQYAEIINVGASTHTNALVVDSVRKQLGGGDIYWSDALTAGTGFMVAVDSARQYFDLAVGVDVSTAMEKLSLQDNWDLYGVAFECVVPRIWQTTAVAPFNTL